MPASGSAGTGVTAVPAESSDQLLLPAAGPRICSAEDVEVVWCHLVSFRQFRLGRSVGQRSKCTGRWRFNSSILVWWMFSVSPIQLRDYLDLFACVGSVGSRCRAD